MTRAAGKRLVLVLRAISGLGIIWFGVTLFQDRPSQREGIEWRWLVFAAANLFLIIAWFLSRHLDRLSSNRQAQNEHPVA